MHRRGKYARADVGNLRELEQSLEGSILSVSPVDHGKGDIEFELGGLSRAILGDEETTRGSAREEDGGSAKRVLEVLFRVSQPPSPLDIDGDWTHAVALGVERFEDASGGFDGDLVFG